MRILCLVSFAVSSVAFVPSTLRCVVPPFLGNTEHLITNSVDKLHRSSVRLQYDTRRCQALRAAGDEGATSREGGLAQDNGEGMVGVIVCDHGSRREQANDMLFVVAERYRSFAGCDIVEVRFNVVS